MFDTVPQAQVIVLRDKSFSLISAILSSIKVEATIDKDILEDVAHFFLRDIYRIDRQQKSSISVSKFAGYWAFWLRKLKPISGPKALTDEAKKYSEARSINEIVSLQFGLEMLMKFRGSDGLSDNVMRSCKRKSEKLCDGSQCLKKYSEKYLDFDNEFYHEYIIYSLRNRTFGPHHFALLFENITFSACEGVR